MRRNLSTLCLYGVRIPLTKLKEILRSLGRGLQTFGTCIDGQEECRFERLCGLLQAAAMYNPELRNLEIFDCGHWSREIDNGSDSQEWQAWHQQQGRVATSLLKRLEQNAPFVSHSLHNKIRYLVPD